MRYFTPTSVFTTRFRACLISSILFLLSTAQALAATPRYSNSNQYSNYRPYSTFTVPVVGTVLESGVQFPERAADISLTNYAVLNAAVGLASAETLRLELNGTGGVATDRVGVMVGNVSTSNNLLNINALGVLKVRTYNASNQVQETHVVSAAVAKAILLAGDRPTQLEFVATLPFTKVELEVGGLAAVSYKLKVYYAYAVPSLQPQPVRGLASRFTASDLTPYYNTAITPGDLVSVCANTNISNPANAVDGTLTNYAEFGTFISVNCPSSLSVKLEDRKTAPAGYYAGFVVGNSSVLDLAALSALRITTYQTINGVRTKQESATGADILDLKLLPDGKYQVSFPTTKAFDEVKIEQLSALAALNNLDIYYGFGVEPSAFKGTTRILSDFNTSTAPNKYDVNRAGVLCVSCGVTTPEGAADNDPATKAIMNVDAGALSTVELKLDLNGATAGNVGVAGYRAGMVISSNSGLIDASLLDRMTLTTYDANGNLLESAVGSSLIGLTVLPDGKKEISFLTTQNFASVQLSIASTVALGVNLNVYQAFADNLAGGIITTINPLPVELTAFSGKWVNGAAELNWATASEKNSSYFVVERSTGADVAFRPVGQVAAAGTSTGPRTYKLRDAEAGAQAVPTLYYRLHQVDLDGKETFSSLVAVAVGKLAVEAAQLEVYPNPAPDAQAITVRCLNLPAAGALVQTYSQMGQLVSQLPVVEASSRLALPTLAPGLYYVVLRTASGQQLATQNLVVGEK